MKEYDAIFRKLYREGFIIQITFKRLYNNNEQIQKCCKSFQDQIILEVLQNTDEYNTLYIRVSQIGTLYNTCLW